MRGYGDWCWWPGNWFGGGGMFMVFLSVLLIFLLVSLIRSMGGKSSRHQEALDILN